MRQTENIYWSQRYRSGNTGWDIGEVSRPLKEYIDQLTKKEISILIPGCGNAYEAKYLMESGFTDVTMLDISETVIQNTSMAMKNWLNNGLKIIHGDFFDHNGKYDLILEQTFLCAIDPSLRGSYIRKNSELLKPGGTLAGVLFNRTFEGGPPFSGSINEYKELFASAFNLEILEPCYNSILPRRGTEVFFKAKPLIE